MQAFVLCGLPGSGKTTLAKQLAEQFDANVHSIDDIPGSWGNPDIEGNNRRKWMDNIKADLRTGNSVVCDSLAITAEGRRWIIKELSGFNCEKLLCVKVVPIEECLERNRKRDRKVPDDQIRLVARCLEAPTDDEGWDHIFVNSD